MKTQRVGISLVLISCALALSACHAGDADSSEGIKVSWQVSKESDASDVGLPHYPGAKPYTEDHDSTSGGNLRFSTPRFGLKVAATKLETSDDPQQVAVFYRQALAKYGTVIECSEASNTKRVKEQELTCDEDEYERDTRVYKAGSKSNQRIVAIEPHGRGARFSLVHVDVRTEETH